MPIILNEYRSKLIDHILYARSQEEVTVLIDAAMRALEQHRLYDQVISRFVEKILTELDEFSPMNKPAQHWSNIKTARILFNRIRRNLNSPVH